MTEAEEEPRGRREILLQDLFSRAEAVNKSVEVVSTAPKERSYD
jgi:hypothetical protein